MAVVWPLLAACCTSLSGADFLPRADEGGFVVDYLTPPGTALEETDRVLKKIERVLLETPEVAAIQRRTGSELGLFATPQNSGDVLVRLKARNQRDRSSEEIISDLRGRTYPSCTGASKSEFVQLLQDMLGDLEGNPTPIEVKILRRRCRTCSQNSGEQVEEALRQVDGLVRHRWCASAATPEITVANRFHRGRTTRLDRFSDGPTANQRRHGSAKSRRYSRRFGSGDISLSGALSGCGAVRMPGRLG
jgi:multidrug efflux pump subunit AcrB